MKPQLFMASMTVLGFALSGAQVHAQSSDIRPGAEERTTQTPDGLDDIVVVARRTEERLQSVPLSVTAISDETIRNASITTATDLIRVVPTLVVAQGLYDAGTSYSLRGIKTGVTTYFNEVPVQGVVVDNQLWDLGSIQAISGPQGTLFGRNSTGGAILFVPQRPTSDFEGFVEAGYGNNNLREATAVINIPFGEVLRVRIGGRMVRRNGVVKNTLGPDYQSIHRDFARVSAVFEPVSWLSNYTVFDYGNRDETPYSFITSPVNPTLGCFPGLGCVYGNLPTQQGDQQNRFGIRKIASSFDTFLKNEQWGVSNILTAKLGQNFTLKHILGHRDGSSNQFKNQVSLDLPVQLGRNFVPKWKTTTNELQLIAGLWDNRLQLTTGAFISDQTVNSGNSYQLLGQIGQPFQDSRNSFNISTSTGNAKAIYAQGTLQVVDGLKFTAGIRYTKDKATLRTSQFGPAFFFFGPQVCQLPKVPGVDLVNCSRFLSAEYDAVTYNVSLDYAVTDKVLLYAATRRGYNGGGFNPNVPQANDPTAPQTAYGPERITDYEAGIKADWQLGAMPVRTNLSVFLAKYNDIQRSISGIDSTGQPFIGIATGPKATIYGAQFELTARPFRGFQLNGTLGLLNTRYDTAAPGFVAGNSFAQAPKATFSVGTTYTHELDAGGTIVANAAYTHQSSITFQDVNVGSMFNRQKAYGLLDMRLDWNGIAGLPVDLGVYVKNLTQTNYALERQDVFQSFGFVGTVYNDPRSFGAQLRYRF